MECCYKRFYRFILFLYFCNLAGFQAYADDLNQKDINFGEKPAQRIVSLAPNLTEMLFAIGAGSKIVATSSFSDYPLAAKKIPIVANYNDINIEALVLLKPDLIVALNDHYPQKFLSMIKSFHIPIYYLDCDHLTDIPFALKKLGILTGTSKEANKIANDFQKKITTLKNTYSTLPKVTVFYQLSSVPLMTINHQSLINDMINLCGGRNIFADTYAIAPMISNESVLWANPDIIIGNINDQFWQKPWLRWPELTAVRLHHLYSVDPNLVERPGPRAIQGTLALCQAFEKARANSL